MSTESQIDTVRMAFPSNHFQTRSVASCNVGNNGLTITSTTFQSIVGASKVPCSSSFHDGVRDQNPTSRPASNWNPLIFGHHCT